MRESERERETVTDTEKERTERESRDQNVRDFFSVDQRKRIDIEKESAPTRPSGVARWHVVDLKCG